MFRLLATIVVCVCARSRKKKSRKSASSDTCTNINLGAKPCSGSGTYKSLLDFTSSASGKSAASADLALTLTDYSVQEIDWAKAVAQGTCQALPECNGSGRTDGIKGRKDINDRVCSQSGTKLASQYSGWSISELNKQKKARCKTKRK